MPAMALSKPELYDLVRELREEHDLPVETIAHQVGTSRQRVYLILADLGIKTPTIRERIAALPRATKAACAKARKR